MIITPNPYIIGDPIKNVEHFYGREELLKNILNSNNRAFCIYGLRRVGKTSLLYMLRHAFAKASKKIPIYFNLQGRSDALTMGQSLIMTIKRLSGSYEELKNFNYSKANLDFVAAIEAWDDFCYSNALESVLLIDEVEKLLPINGMAPVNLEGLRRVIVDESKNITTVITGSRTILQLASIPSVTSPLLHGFKTLPLRLFSNDEAHLLITQSNTIGVEETTLKEIADKCGGHPYFLQSSCSEVYDLEKRSLNLQRDWGLNIDILNILEDEFKRLSNLEIFILRNLRFDTPTPTSILQSKINAPRIELGKALVALSDIGLIKNIGNVGYQLNDIFWELFLNQLFSKSIFIAHHRNKADERYFKVLQTHLARSKFAIRTDVDILPGAEIKKMMREEVANAELIILLLSPDFLDKMYWVAEYALQLKKHIIPIIARPCGLSKEIEDLQCWPQNGIALSLQKDMDAALSPLPKVIETILSTLTP